MGKLFRRIYYLLNWRRLNRELEEEMASHCEMMPEDRRSHFGNIARFREQSAERWGWTWADDLWRDLMYGGHSLLRSPGFTVAAVLALALGMGVNLAEFHIFNAAVHRLRLNGMDRLARVSRDLKGRTSGQFAPEAVAFYREYNSSFSSIFEEAGAGRVNLEGDQTALYGTLVSGNFFGVLGVLPAYGRLLDEGDAKPGAPAVVVLGYAYWQARFGGDPAIVGRTIRLNGKPVQVVGVGPYNFSGVGRASTSVWLPITLEGSLPSVPLTEANQTRSESMFGRLKPGVTFEAAQSEFQSLTSELQTRQPELVEPGERIWVDRIDAVRIDPKIAAVASLFILLVLSVLLTACANLGNMLLARGLMRRREIEIRLAIGAAHWRVIRQLMTENLLLGMLGAVLALAVGRVAAQVLFSVSNQGPDFRLVTDWRILGGAAVLTFIAVSAFGLMPAVRTVRPGPQTARAGKILVAFQVAVSCTFLILSSLVTRGLVRHLGSSVSIDYGHMIVADPALYLQNLDGPSARQSLDDRMSRVRGLAAVKGVTLASIPPFGGRTWIEKPAGIDKPAGLSPPVYLNAVDSSYFDTMRLRFLAGRNFRPAERQDATIVSQSAARELWPAENPLGKSLDLRGRTRTIIGVVADSGINSVVAPDSVEAYLPLDDQSIAEAVLLVHVNAKPDTSLGVVRAAASVSDRVPLVSSMDNDLAKHTAAARNLLTVFGALSTTATMLAATGIFGLIAFTVSRQTKEIGIRLALGASSSRILRALLDEYVTPVSAGLLAGIAIAMLASRAIQAVRGEIPLFDPLSYAAALLCFVGIAAVAALLPCLRALKIEPASALRCD